MSSDTFHRAKKEKGETMSKADKVSMFSDYLRSEGYLPSIDEDGDINFKCEGRTYWIIFSEKDDEFFQIIYPNFWSIESESERAKVEKAALIATGGIKVAKVYPTSDNVHAAVELFCPSADEARSILKRSISALGAAINKFRDEMQK
jgi:hypothetical protein